MNVDEWLSGGGAPSVSWKNRPIGYTVEGPICEEPVVQQQRDYDTGEPETWPDGRPKMVLVLTVKTAMRDPERFDDDGARRIFFQGKSLSDGIREEARKAGGKLLVGGYVRVELTGQGPQPDKKKAPPNLFRVSYTPPDRQAVADFLGAGGQGAATPVASPPPRPEPVAAAPRPVQAPAPAGLPAGIDAGAWSNLDEARRAQILAVMAGAGSGEPPF